MWFWKVILKLIKPYAGYAALSAIFSFLSVVFSLFSLTMIIPFLELLFQDTIPQIPEPVLRANPESLNEWFRYQLGSIIQAEGKEGALWIISFVVITLFFLKNLFRYLANFFMSPLRNKVVMDLRNTMYERILILPLSYFSRKRSGDILSRISGDVQEVEWSVMSFLIMLFRQPIALVIFVTALIFISPGLTLVALLLIPIAGYVISLSGKWLNRIAMKGQQQLGGLVSMIEETIGGIRIIKSFNAIDTTEAQFKEQNQVYTKLLTRIYRQRDLAAPLTEVIAILAMVCVIWFGGQQVLNPQNPMDAKVFLLYLAIFSQIIPPAKSLISAYYNILKGAASMERIQEVIQEDESIADDPAAIEKVHFTKSIEIRNLNFKYQDDYVLKDVSLKLKKGERLAIVGPSGSGKTTLLNLLPRFYDCPPGTIFIDGIDIRKVRIHSLRAMMGLVSQDTILFNDTVKENILFGKAGVREEDIVKAARIAHADEFIREMPQSYDTIVGDRGIKMSGGQRQRLALARAILRNPPILLLDEATSALDTQSEREVQAALDDIMQERTSLVVAHRLSTIMEAHKIIVMENGRIAEEGNHESLLAAKGLYYRLWMMQTAE